MPDKENKKLTFSEQRKDKATILVLLFEYLVFPLTRLLARFRPVTPNHVSLVVLAFFILSAYLFFSAEGADYRLACFCFMLGAILDTVDGALARLTKRTSATGKMIDLAIDRFGIGIILIALCWNYTKHHDTSASFIWGMSFAFYMLISVNTIFHLFHKPIDINNINEQEIGGIRRAFYRQGISFPPVGDYEIVFVLLAIMPLTDYFLQGMILGVLILIARLFVEYFIFWK